MNDDARNFSRYRDDDRKSVHHVHSDSSDATLVEDRAEFLPSSSPNGKEDIVKQLWLDSTLSSTIPQQTCPNLDTSPFTPSLDQCYPDPPERVYDVDDMFIDSSPPTSLGSYLVKTIGAESYIPRPSEVFHSLLRSEGAVWVNKLPFVHWLCPSRTFSGDTLRKLSLVRRPAGFGQRLFMTTATFSCDINSEDSVERLLDVPPSSPLKHEYLVLSIDMKRAFEEPAASLEDAMDSYMDGVWRDFVHDYHVDVGLPRTSYDDDNWDWHSSASIYPWIMDHICDAGYRLLVFIDNFNHPLIHSTPETIETIAIAINRYLVRPMEPWLECGIIVGGMILGAPLSEEPSWVEEATYLWEKKVTNLFEPIARDISHDTASLHGAFGFTWEQVSFMAAEVLPIAEERTRCLQELRQCCATYGEGAYVEYNVDDVVAFLRRETLPPDTITEMPPFPFDDEEIEREEDEVQT